MRSGETASILELWSAAQQFPRTSCSETTFGGEFCPGCYPPLLSIEEQNASLRVVEHSGGGGASQLFDLR
jgi:hypothetical protein